MFDKYTHRRNTDIIKCQEHYDDCIFCTFTKARYATIFMCACVKYSHICHEFNIAKIVKYKSFCHLYTI